MTLKTMNHIRFLLLTVSTVTVIVLIHNRWRNRLVLQQI